mgnify:FL=1
MNVLDSMDVTLSVPHFEMSALNAAAPPNAAKIYMSMQLMFEPKHQKKEHKKFRINSINNQRENKRSGS